MVHHKLHDANWTGLPLAPADDPQPRYLYPPTTAATLNLAAVAAQCARVFRGIDDAFAARCLTAAETAWTAARAHPAMYARNNFTGGGAYDDTDVSDEFYWAAAELFVTTGKPQYYRFITHSPHFLEVPGTVEPNGVVDGQRHELVDDAGARHDLARPRAQPAASVPGRAGAPQHRARRRRLRDGVRPRALRAALRVRERVLLGLERRGPQQHDDPGPGL